MKFWYNVKSARMFTIDLNKPMMVPDFQSKGKNEGDEHLCNVLAQALTMSTPPKGLGMKCNDWIFNLAEDGAIVCDQTDLDWLLDFVDNNQMLRSLAKGQLIKEFKAAKSDAS